jgi:hypothetical protein
MHYVAGVYLDELHTNCAAEGNLRLRRCQLLIVLTFLDCPFGYIESSRKIRRCRETLFEKGIAEIRKLVLVTATE